MTAPSAERVFRRRRGESLSGQYRKIRHTAEEIRLLNEKEMEKASDDAKAAASAWGLWLAGGLAVTAVLACLLAWTTLRAVLGPLRELAQTADGRRRRQPQPDSCPPPTTKSAKPPAPSTT